MKYIVRSVFFDALSLYIITQIFSGVKIIGGIQNFLLCGFILTILMLIVNPILKIVTFPLTILTLGLYGLVSEIVSETLIVYILTRIMKQFVVKPFILPSFHGFGISSPSLYLSGFLPFLFCGISYFILRGVFAWLK